MDFFSLLQNLQIFLLRTVEYKIIKNLYYHHIWELYQKNKYSKCVLYSDICSRLSKYFYFIADKLEAHLIILTLTSCVSLSE